ncbi:MAG TPA: asparagine synthase B [Thermoplasmata archaeon]|nr:asparagine synthase B [Thermoplasmata archaeon]
MCGIAGIVGEGADPAMLRRMLDGLRHRGPDDLGTYADDGVAIGQARLSIIDVAGGHQPILDEEGRRCIVANGEVYNYRGLAKQLGDHSFRTRSDSEVALHLYEDAGVDCAARLDGMFAFAVWDDGNLYLARDPVGIKPLYYAIHDGTFYFASEVKGLLPATHSGIREFPNGHWYRTDLGLRSYATWETRMRPEIDAEDAVREIRRLLDAAVEDQLMSEVPLGTFCSGGLDSTLVTAIASRHLETFHTFSTGMAGAPDLESAFRAAEALGTTHHVREFAEDEALDLLPNVIWHLESFDAALVRSAIPTYFVSELAREHVTVVLTGEGADELYAGYGYLKDLPKAAFHPELVRITQGLHNLNLQRTDRMTMAHGLEGRVPYLDWRHVNFALGLPVDWKIHGDDQIEKWVLRRAAEGVLPDDLVWRGKEKFAEGTGSVDLVRREAERQLTDTEFARVRAEAHPLPLQTKEEAYCYKLFRERFPKEVAIECLGRTRVY